MSVRVHAMRACEEHLVSVRVHAMRACEEHLVSVRVHAMRACEEHLVSVRVHAMRACEEHVCVCVCVCVCFETFPYSSSPLSKQGEQDMITGVCVHACTCMPLTGIHCYKWTKLICFEI